MFPIINFILPVFVELTIAIVWIFEKIIAISEIIKLKSDEDLKIRKTVLENILKSYFLENDRGNVEGIVNFRLNEYKKILNNQDTKINNVTIKKIKWQIYSG